MIDEMRYAPAGDTKIAYRIVGSGEPILILSGLGDSILDWKEEIIQSLAQNFCVILPDNRGMGRTRMGTIHPQRMTIVRYVEDVYAVCVDANVTEIYLLGHSMGGMIAQEFVLAHPEMIRKLVLFATDYGPESGSRAHLMNLCVRPLQMLCVISPWHTKGFRAGACAIASWNGTADRLCTIGCRTMILQGDSDYLMHTEMAGEMARRIPRAVLKIVPGGGHRMHDLYCREFAKTVTDFLLKKEG